MEVTRPHWIGQDRHWQPEHHSFEGQTLIRVVQVCGDSCKTSAGHEHEPAGMTPVELWRWQLRSKATGRTYLSHRLMTEAEALAKDPMAVRAEWSLVVQWVPDKPVQPTPKRWPP